MKSASFTPRSPRRGSQPDAPRRIVVKVGSGVVAGKGRLKPKVVADLAYDLSVLRHRGCDVVLVMSGAVASGFTALGFKTMPALVLDRQAAAAVGQPRLMATMARAFARHRVTVAQVLMSAADIEDRRRFISARHTLLRLLAGGALPILNENDALSEHEATIGDNDHLAALVTNVVSADLLIILSRVAGVLDLETGAVIPRVEVGSTLDRHITREMSDTGRGGMVAKVRAARLASDWGVRTVIADGTKSGTLQQIIAGPGVGTEFVPRSAPLNARKRWIAVRNRSLGVIRVDDGARKALTARNASLLPMGIVAVDGDFRLGARVDLAASDGVVFAVGLASYDADDIRRIAGRKQAEIAGLLGYQYVKEVVHRDDLVLLGGPAAG